MHDSWKDYSQHIMKSQWFDRAAVAETSQLNLVAGEYSSGFRETHVFAQLYDI